MSRNTCILCHDTVHRDLTALQRTSIYQTYPLTSDYCCCILYTRPHNLRNPFKSVSSVILFLPAPSHKLPATKNFLTNDKSVTLNKSVRHTKSQNNNQITMKNNKYEENSNSKHGRCHKLSYSCLASKEIKHRHRQICRPYKPPININPASTS